jgi:DNA polymerase epsilon subunit 2
VGLHCGAGWKDDGLADGVLDEVAKLWKAQRPRDPLVREDGGLLAGVLKVVAGMMVGGRVRKGLSRQGSFVEVGEKGVLSRQTSFGMSSLGIGEGEEQDEKEGLKDVREWLRIVDAWEQPRLVYNLGKRHFER